MRILFFLSLFSGGNAFALPPDQGHTPWREVICYVKDSRGVEYTARGFRERLARVQRQALRECQFYSERPSTCRLLRCRP